MAAQVIRCITTLPGSAIPLRTVYRGRLGARECTVNAGEYLGRTADLILGTCPDGQNLGVCVACLRSVQRVEVQPVEGGGVAPEEGVALVFAEGVHHPPHGPDQRVVADAQAGD